MNKNMKREVCGEFPEFCYRAFDRKKYAEEFINSGKFRLRCFGSCRNMEVKSRCDSTEGFGRTIEPGIVTKGLVSPNPEEKTIWIKEKGYQEHHIEQGNKKYLLSMSLPEVKRCHMLRNFGEYIVKINEPKKLAEDINNYFISEGQKIRILGCRVVYNKGKKLDRELINNERLDLAYKQKPESFKLDCEFRIVANKLGEVCEHECKFLDGLVEPNCEYLDVDLNKPLGYVEMQK